MCFLVLLSITLGCNLEDSFKIPAADNGRISNYNIRPQGNITETENGYIVEGSLTIDTESSGDVIFENANLDVQFNDDGTLMSIRGTAEVPAPTNYFEFENPVQADIGFFTGKFLNENRDFEIKLVDESSYFVFAISLNIEMKIGANDNPEAQKPLSIKVPVGGHITFIADYTDPMFFFSLGGNALGGDGNNERNNNNNGNASHSKLASVNFGASFNSNFTYTPTNLVDDHVVSFKANQVTGGTVSFFKILEASGMFYQNRGFSTDINFNEPMESDFGVNYRAGINGQLDLSLEITSFISFGFPIGSASAAIVAEANTNNGITAKAFINGLVEPDLSWWPSIIPVKPSGKMNAYGFVEQTGNFDIGLSGSFSLETPTGTQAIDGAMRATQEAFTLEGQVTVDNEIWKANATFTKDETKVIASTPNNFTEGIAQTVTSQIDAAIETTENAIADLEAANEQYEFELSLRGLRTALPTIITRAQNDINIVVSNAISSGRNQANQELGQNGQKICSDNFNAIVNSIVKPYRDALNRLKNAVNDTNDNAQTRIEIEAALRQLASRDRINSTEKVTITHGTISPNCWFQGTSKRNVTINQTVINPEQKAQLLEAANNVQYIAEADGIRINAQDILNQLPTIRQLENLRDGVDNCVSELTNGLGKAGFRYNHNTKNFNYFIVINGEEKEVSSFTIFNGDELIEKARIKTGGCNPDGALKRLQLEAKNKRSQ
jgi:hypothetical protein